MIRAFVAIPMPQDITRDLIAAQAGLPAGHPVPPENFHVTLAYLGEHPGNLIEDVHLELARIRTEPFPIKLAGAGMFGSKRPRVVYAGIEAGPELRRLREKVLRCASEAGIRLPRERYTPHVTLARLPSDLAPEDAAELRDFTARRANLTSAHFNVEGFTLFRSNLGRNGAIYEALAEYPLNS